MTDDAQRRAPAARAGEHTPADLLTTVPTYSELALGYPTLGPPSADMAAWARTLDLAGVPDGVRCAIEALTDDGHVLQIVAVAQACELASVDRALPVESRETMTEWRDRARLVAAIAGHRQCALAAMHTLDVDAGATEDPVQRRQVLCTRAEASHIVRQVELGTYDAANAWRPENRLLSRQMAWVDLVDEATIVTATAPRAEPEFDVCFDGLDDNVVSGLPPVTHAAALQLQRTLDVPGVSEALVGGGGVVLLDVPDALTLAVLKDTADAKRGVPFGVEMLAEDAPAKHHEAAKRERQYVACLRREQPVLALSPDAGTCLPAVALRAADHRLTLSPICGADVAAVIRGTTGRPSPTPTAPGWRGSRSRRPTSPRRCARGGIRHAASSTSSGSSRRRRRRAGGGTLRSISSTAPGRRSSGAAASSRTWQHGGAGSIGRQSATAPFSAGCPAPARRFSRRLSPTAAGCPSSSRR
ncbi:hypothetical protein [Methylobacterium tardum]|uniref:hypothetical protein n=1 Tax=Methylobacterium tardum TaxID=374432 RepID=UPI00361A7400